MDYDFNPKQTSGFGVTPSINTTEGLGYNSQVLKKLQSAPSAGANFDVGGSFADKFRINPTMFNPSSNDNSMFKNFTGLAGKAFNKVGGLAGIGDLLAGIGAFQSAGVGKDQLEEDRAARLFSNKIATGNFNNQVSTLNTQYRDRQNTRNARSGNDGSVMATDEYMGKNGLSEFRG